MAQSFVTTYNNFYRRHRIERTKPIRHDAAVDVCDMDKDAWLVIKDLEHDRQDDENFANAVEAVANLRKKRLVTTYQRDFCAKELDDDSRSKLSDCNKLLYERKYGQVLPPVPTWKKAFCVRASRLYTPYTVYQDDIGRLGYYILEKSKHQ